MIRQGEGHPVEFTVLAARVAHDLNQYGMIHQRIGELDAEMQQLDCKRGDLMTKCDHPAKRITTGAQGIESIFCQVCGQLFDKVEIESRLKTFGGDHV